MITYSELKRKHEKELSEFPLMFAFTNEQFAEGMKKLGLKETDTDKMYDLGSGCYMRKSDNEKLDQLLNAHDKEFRKAIAEDTTGDGFIYDMFNYELGNHEYCITYDVHDALDALGLTLDEIVKDDRLTRGFYKAIKNQKDE